MAYYFFIIREFAVIPKPQVKWWRSDEGAGRPLVGHEADLTLTLLLLQAHLDPSVTVGAAAAEHDDEGPNKPEPPKFIVVGAAFCFSTAVAHLTPILLIVYPKTKLLCLHQTSPCTKQSYKGSQCFLRHLSGFIALNTTGNI